MAIKIMIDAGHYKDYNRSNTFKLYYEGNMTFQLQGYLKKELEAYGFKVSTTRQRTSENPSLYNRGFMAKGYDLFLSLHSNACGTESVDRVVVIKGYDQPDTLAKALAIAIHDTMQPKQKYQIYKKTTSTGGEYYGVLRGAKAAGVANRFILEHSFHTNNAMATWLYSDAHLKKLAKAEAKAIAKYYGYDKKEEKVEDDKTGVYRVLVDTLNIRKGPGTSYDKVGELHKGDAYTVVKTEGSWGYLKTGAGWISLGSSYVLKVK